MGSNVVVHTQMIGTFGSMSFRDRRGNMENDDQRRNNANGGGSNMRQPVTNNTPVAPRSKLSTTSRINDAGSVGGSNPYGGM